MRELVEKTGGIVINEEEFILDVYEKSLSKYFGMITDPNAVYNAKMNVECSKEIYVSGMLGPGQLFEKASDFPKDGDNLIGETGGNKFYLNSPINTTTYLLFFSHRKASINQKQKPCFF